MHELSATHNCVSDPAYDPNVCGFSEEADTCVPLDGCGTPVAYIYFFTFTLLVTFVLLNIFIAVILEGFANEKDRASSVLLPQHVRTVCRYLPAATAVGDCRGEEGERESASNFLLVRLWLFAAFAVGR